MGKLIKNVIFAWLVLINLILIPKELKSQDKDSMIVVNNWDNSGYDFDLQAIPIRKAYQKIFKAKSISIPLHYLNKIILLTKKINFRSDLVIAVAIAESSLNSFAISPKGAVGLMQLMKPTAQQYGVFNRYNYSENLEAGIKHLKYLYEKYNYNISLTLAAYNAGETSVEKYYGVPPYPETRQYIQRILNIMRDSSKLKVESHQKIETYKIKTKDGRLIIVDNKDN